MPFQILFGVSGFFCKTHTFAEANLYKDMEAFMFVHGKISPAGAPTELADAYSYGPRCAY